MDARFTGELAHSAAFGFRLGNIWGGFDTGLHWALSNAAFAQQNAGGENIGGVIGGFASFFAPPQNSTFNIPGITNLVNQELADPDCAKFAETILNQLSKARVEV
jgi:hypothetical protein